MLTCGASAVQGKESVGAAALSQAPSPGTLPPPTLHSHRWQRHRKQRPQRTWIPRSSCLGDWGQPGSHPGTSQGLIAQCSLRSLEPPGTAPQGGSGRCPGSEALPPVTSSGSQACTVSAANAGPSWPTEYSKPEDMSGLNRPRGAPNLEMASTPLPHQWPGYSLRTPLGPPSGRSSATGPRENP